MDPTHLILLAASNPDMPNRFVEWLRDNLHVWHAFEAEALEMVNLGYERYSARTILEYLRHHSLISEKGGEGWKLNNVHTPYLARLFAMAHPEFASLFDFRQVTTSRMENAYAQSKADA